MVESDSWRNTSAGVELSAASSGKSPKSRRKKKAVAGVDEAASAEESKIVGIEILDEEEGDSRKQSTDLLAPPGAEAASGSTAPAPVEEVAGGADDVATCEDCLKQRVVSTRTFDNKPYQLCGNCNRKREREARRAEAGETGAAAGATARPGADKAEHSDFTDYMGTLRHKRGAQIASFHPNKCAWWFAGVLTRFPYLVMALSMFIPLVFSLVVGANEFVLDTGEEGFRVVGEPVANRYDAVKLGRSETVYRELSPEQQAIVDASVLERSQVKFSLQVIFEATDGGSVFRPDHLAKIRSLHETIVTSPDYEDYCVLLGNTSNCLFPQSLLQYMYPEVIEVGRADRKRASPQCSTHVTCGQCASDPDCSWCEKPVTGAGRPFRCVEQGSPDEAYCNAIVPLANCSLEYVYPSGLGEYLVEDPEAVLERLWLNNMSIVEPYVDRGFREFNYRSTVTTSIFMFGAPLVKDEETGELYSLDDEDMDEQLAIFTDWIVADETGIADFLLDWDDETLDIFFIGSGITDLLIDAIIAGDGALAAGAMVVIGLFMRLHTGSTCLTVSGMTHILISFPTAMFINTYIFGVPKFNMLLTLGIFTVLGIGADNVFLFSDLWKQSSVVSSEVSSSTRTRMAWTYQKALHTMSVSTITTSAAFMANGTSSIPPIRQFGLFTGALILVQFLLVVTWFPAVIVVYSRYFETGRGDKKEEGAGDVEMSKIGAPKRSAGAKFGAGTIRAIRLQLGLDGDTDTDDKIDQYRYLERFFFETFAPAVHRHRKLIFLTFSILFGVSGYLATQLEPAKEAARFLPDDDPTQRALDLQETRFRENDYQGKLAFVFGLREPDRSDADSNDPDDLGVTRIIEDFSINKVEEQQFLSEFCKDVRAKVEVVKKKQVLCFIEALQEWRLSRNESALVPEDEFYDALRQFTNEYVYPQDGAPAKISFTPVVEFGSEMTVRYDTEGRREDDLIPLFITIIANTTLTRDFPASVGSPIEDDIWDFLNAQMEKAPPGLKGAFHVTHDAQWVRIATEEVLQTSAILGIFISLAFAFVIVVIATRNVAIAGLVTFTVSGVVLTFIGFMVALGWSLGIIESVSMVVLVGLSCDSLIHISVAYLESDEQSRFLKARQGLLEIGTSVVSAVFTTMLSAIFLMLTTVIFFKRFGIFTFVVMLSSGLHGFFFLVALLMTIGPVGKQGDVVAFVQGLRR